MYVIVFSSQLLVMNRTTLQYLAMFGYVLGSVFYSNY